MLKGVDVSSNQAKDICAKLDMDFAIVKATGNPNMNGYTWTYRNPYIAQQANDTLNRGKCLGLYHFAYGADAAQEADHFVQAVINYVGKALLVLDYEAPLSNRNNSEWCRAFLRRVKARTGTTCALYASSSVIKAQNLVQLCKEEGVILWSANYWKGSQEIANYDINGLKMDIPESKIWQFTENGTVGGYKKLDCDIFYGDAKEWNLYAQGKAPESNSNGLVLAVDGKWGSNTTIALQKALGVVQDGKIMAQRPAYFNAVNKGGLLSNSWSTGDTSYSITIKALQEKVEADSKDGQFGTYACKALQKYLGVTQDGVIGNPSVTVKEMQRRLNAGSF